MPQYVVGFDVGGTRIKSGGVSPGGRLLKPSTSPSGFTLGPQRLLKVLVAEVKRLTKELGEKPQAIGLGFPGGVHPDKGVVFLPGKLKGLEGFPIVPRLSKAVGVPVVADNDGRISIYAESTYGLARYRDWAVTVTIGTGVGSGVKLDGRIMRDPHLQFGTQLAHLVQQAHGGRLCITNSRGTAEMMCSATSLAMQVRDGLARGIPSSLSERYFDDAHAIDFKAVARAASAGDRLCLDELEHWTQNLGWLLVSAVHVYAPEIIILSGGATQAAGLYLEKLRDHVNRHIFRYPPGDPVPIELSKLRTHSGVLGTGALAWERVESIRTKGA